MWCSWDASSTRRILLGLWGVVVVRGDDDDVGREGWDGSFWGDPTMPGVAARELRDCASGSAKTLSMKAAAPTMVASEPSDACSEDSSEFDKLGSTRLEPRDRNMTSSASCVRPLCDLDPRIVWLYNIKR